MAYVLTNPQATFTFDTDGTTGLKLTSFSRYGGHTWVNAETNLWKAKVYDTTTAPATATANITPTAATFSLVSQSATQLVFRWTAVPVGTDAITVTLTCALAATSDTLRTTIAAAWVGTPTKYALHSIGPLPLKIDPLNQGSDFAVMSAVFGILSENPILNLRQANGVPGFPDTGWNLQSSNRWTWPAGRGWPIGLWGYYSGSEGWMVYLEDHTLEWFYCTFQSDATRLTWEADQEQPDNVLVANNAHALGSGHTWCLCPLEITNAHGWWDIGVKYRERVEANPPSFYVPALPDRTDLSDAEKAPGLFIDMHLLDTTHVPSDGLPGDLTGLLNTIRNNSGAPAGTPIHGIVEANDYNLQYVGETPDGDLQGKLLTLYNDHNCFLEAWWPEVNQSNGPGVWSAYRWDRNVGDSAELRWWQTNDEMGTMRMDRTGYLAGGGDDRLQSQSSGFYRQRIYPVTGYAAGPPRVVSVTGAPNTDGFTGTLIAVIIPASASARIGRAPVSSLGAASVTVSSDFLDSLGATVTPVGGDTLAVFRDTSQMDAFCPEARINGSTYLTRLINNTSVGIQASWGACGNYLDTWSEPLLQSATRSCCYRDHSTWSGIDPGYTRHPYGGGDWYKIALREFLHQWKQRARTAQALTGRDPFFRVSGEDIDETVLDRIDWCWHPVSAGYLWRVTKVGGAVADPAIHKYKTIPLWSVVYPGRTMGRGLDNELSSIILEPVLYADDELIRFFGYCLGVEWPYGITWPTLSLYEDSTIALKDWFDDTQYVSGGGLVPNKVKQIRDLWVQIMRAELNFLLDRGFRYGEMMPPAVVDIAATTTTTGMAQSTWTAGAPNYQSYDTIYERTAFPRVTHSFWKAADGTLVGVFCNWSDTAGAWSGTIDTAAFGVGGPGSTGAKRMTVMRVDSTEAVDLDITFDGDTGVLSMGSVAAYSMAAVFFTPERSSGMTLADLKQCVLDWLQTTFADGPWTENEVERHLRDGELIVHSMAAEKFEDFCITSALVSEVSGTAIIDLPANVFRVVKVERVVGGLATTAAPIPLRKMSRNVTDEQLARGSRWPYGAITPGTAESPMNYYQHGQKSIELFPTPATTVTNSLKVTYIYVPDPMVDDTDVPFQEAHGPGGVGKDSITSFHDILCKYAAEMCFLKEEAYPQADRVKQERMMRQAQLMQHLSHMNVQEPRYIRNPDMGW